MNLVTKAQVDVAEAEMERARNAYYALRDSYIDESIAPRIKRFIGKFYSTIGKDAFGSTVYTFHRIYGSDGGRLLTIDIMSEQGDGQPMIATNSWTADAETGIERLHFKEISEAEYIEHVTPILTRIVKLATGK